MKFTLISCSFALGVLLFTGCAGEEVQQSPTLHANTEHQAMVARLAAFAKTADPAKFYHLNTKRAEGIRTALAQAQDQNTRFQLSYSYISELLASNQLGQAEAELANLLPQVPLRENTKPIFDLEALLYLRAGELENCQNNHNEASCLLPIRGGGLHTNRSGSKTAITKYEKLLQTFPDDYQSKYLLNLAHQTIGSYPDGVPAQHLLDKMDTKRTDRTFVDRAGHGGLGVNRLSGGVALGDFDGDGYIDIFATSYGFHDDAKLFLSSPEGGFAEAEAHLTGITGGLNCQAADYDNDGDLDVLVLRGGWFGAAGTLPNSLLQNDGSGRFTDVTVSAGLGAAYPTQTAAWADFDLDGDLDLFIGNEASNDGLYPCELYLNEKGRFKNVAPEAGINLIAMAKGVTAGDIDGDGYPEIYVSCLGQDNKLYLNTTAQQGRLSFKELASTTEVNRPQFSFPTWMFDYDQDGDLDLVASGYDVRSQNDAAGVEARLLLGIPTGEDPLVVYQNQGDGSFKDLTAAIGLDRPTFTMGCNFGDLNNSGFPDLYLGTGTPDLRSVVPNLFYENKNGVFSESGMAVGLAHIQKGHGVGFADFDRDGDLDIYTVLGGAFEGDSFPNALFENQQQGQGAWVSLLLKGKTANRSAIGAQVTAFAKTSTGEQIVRHHWISTGASFGGNALEAHLGLATASQLDSVVVQWPTQNKRRQKFESLKLNTRYVLPEGQAATHQPLPTRVLGTSHTH